MKASEQRLKLLKEVIDGDLPADDGLGELHELDSDHLIKKLANKCTAAEVIGIKSEVSQTAKSAFGTGDTQRSVPQSGIKEGNSRKVDGV